MPRKKPGNGVDADPTHTPTDAPAPDGVDAVNGVGASADADPTPDAAQVVVRRRHLSDYQRDAHNPNKGSARGREILRRSLEERGAGRSLLAASDDVFIAGNQTMDEARQAGITDVIEIETDGRQLVVVKRKDLTSDDPRARQLAYDDNRSRDHAQWVLDVIEQDWGDGVDMTDYFDADEIEELINQSKAEAVVDAALNAAGEGGSVSRGLTNDKARQIKVVLFAPDVAVIERALRETGNQVRGEALVQVCEYYLESRRQQHAG